MCENQPGKPDKLVIVPAGTNHRHFMVILGLKFVGFLVLLPTGISFGCASVAFLAVRVLFDVLKTLTCPGDSSALGSRECLLHSFISLKSEKGRG